MIPNEIFSLAAVAPSRPRTYAGTYVVAATVAAMLEVRKSRRVLVGLFIFRLLFIEDSSAEQFVQSNDAVNHESHTQAFRMAEVARKQQEYIQQNAADADGSLSCFAHWLANNKGRNATE
jgi:hypothetical protein